VSHLCQCPAISALSLLTVCVRAMGWAWGPGVQDESERRWFARYIESEGRVPLTHAEKLHVFGMMTRSEVRPSACENVYMCVCVCVSVCMTLCVRGWHATLLWPRSPCVCLYMCACAWELCRCSVSGACKGTGTDAGSMR
jgi:hypothetical protein